ncbi:E3 ubiquitin-protein ligase TRIM21, partial [Mucuna pruriens]
IASSIRVQWTNMSSRTGKGPAVRSYRRRKAVLDLDLNSVPCVENREQEGPSTQPGPQEVQVAQQPQVTQPPMIDVEAIDDDVVECTPRAFAEAKNNSRRNRGRTVVDLDLEDQTAVTNNNNNKRRREPARQTIINCDKYINLEGCSSSTRESVKKPREPPKEPVFNCPICMGPLVEEMSTRCGHIFCKDCIKAAISAQGKCPTCRKKITVKELIRFGHMQRRPLEALLRRVNHMILALDLMNNTAENLVFNQVQLMVFGDP